MERTIIERTTIGRGIEMNGEGRRLIPYVTNYGEAFCLSPAHGSPAHRHSRGVGFAA